MVREWGRRLSAAAMSLMLMAGMTGCAGVARLSSDSQADAPVSEKGKLVLYDWMNEHHAITAIYDEAIRILNEREDLASDITARRIPSSQYYTKLNAAIAANDGPDLFSTHASGVLKMYVDAGRIQPLDAAIANDPEWQASFKPGVFDLLTVNDRIYAIPITFSAVALFYNKRIFEQYGLTPPETYEDLKHVVSRLVRVQVTPFAFGAKTPWTAAMFSEIAQNRIGGDEPYDAVLSGEGSWLDPSFIEAGRMMQELRDMQAFPIDYLELDHNAMNRLFRTGEAAMIVTGSWSISEYAASELKDDVGVVKFPTFAGGKGDPDTWLGQPSYNYAVSTEAKDRTAAIALLKTLTGETVQRRIVEEGGDIPVIDLAPATERMPQVAKELREEMAGMKRMFIFYDVGLGSIIGDAYNNTIKAILAGQPPEEAFMELQMFTEANMGD
jgi:raffinose/stachyose/melibiose transport system substrate-binding protein